MSKTRMQEKTLKFLQSEYFEVVWSFFVRFFLLLSLTSSFIKNVKLMPKPFCDLFPQASSTTLTDGRIQFLQLIVWTPDDISWTMAVAGYFSMVFPPLWLRAFRSFQKLTLSVPSRKTWSSAVFWKQGELGNRCCFLKTRRKFSSVLVAAAPSLSCDTTNLQTTTSLLSLYHSR